jgi:transcriptional regulator with XRE-family HTH domain
VGESTRSGQLGALGAVVREQRLAAGLSLRDVAQRAGVSNAYLSQIERGLHEPSLSVLRAVAAALGVPLGSLLARAGVLDEEVDTEGAILSDPALSEPQRLALLSVYRSFVAGKPTRRLI